MALVPYPGSSSLERIEPEPIPFPVRSASSTEVFAWIGLQIKYHFKSKRPHHNLIQDEDLTGEFLYTESVEALIQSFRKMGFASEEDYWDASNSTMMRKIIGTVLSFRRELESRRMTAMSHSTVVTSSNPTAVASDDISPSTVAKPDIMLHSAAVTSAALPLQSTTVSQFELDNPTEEWSKDTVGVKTEEAEDKDVKKDNAQSAENPSPSANASIRQLPDLLDVTSGAEYTISIHDGAKDEQYEVKAETSEAKFKPKGEIRSSLAGLQAALSNFLNRGVNGGTKHKQENKEINGEGDTKNTTLIVRKSHNGSGPNGGSNCKKENGKEDDDDDWEHTEDGKEDKDTEKHVEDSEEFPELTRLK
ncbi:uncharacterized protein RAG0_05116 [Rhynchosporium agropyri]|uniref:Uncharacterized protein n=1 Tax=Rhynchosporium agropyri TaxID=914238 RepID=A0A1E1KBS9_9HELO|nr:uncharacterized protein RAG0_05116 [Rhynchosporium agropyri]